MSSMVVRNNAIHEYFMGRTQMRLTVLMLFTESNKTKYKSLRVAETAV